jgi:serine protease Do
MSYPYRVVVHLSVALIMLCAAGVRAQSSAAPVAPPVPTPAPNQAAVPAPAPISHDAQRIYEGARDKLVQIRTVLRNSDTQASVGSGFFVAQGGLIITNFHVASQMALEPDRYRGVYVPVDGKEAPVELLAFDVQHDLALRVKNAGADYPYLSFRGADTPLARGERIYSLGNPKDIGFAVTEGTYNGLVLRSFYPRIFFGGTINPGMSGGPVLDESGRVVGINVSKRQDGEQLSFLVPAEFAQALLARGANAQPLTQSAYAEVTRQLLVHQEQLTQRFLTTPLKAQRHGGYSVPVFDDALARCWGSGRDADFKAFDLERTQCQMDSYLFAGDTTTGLIQMRYEAYDGPKLGAMRFSQLYGQSFANERFAVQGTRNMTAAECSEHYIDRQGMVMRGVVCMSAYRKLVGLYDVSVLVASLNRPTQGVQGRMDARGVSFANGLKLVAKYLDGFQWNAPE